MHLFIVKANTFIKNKVTKTNGFVNKNLDRLDNMSTRVNQNLNTHHLNFITYIERDGWTIISNCIGLGAFFSAIIILYKDTLVTKLFAVCGLYLSTFVAALMLFLIAVRVPNSLFRLLFLLLAICLVFCAFSLSFSTPHLEA